MKRLLTVVALGTALVSPAHANEMQQAMETFLQESVVSWANDPVLVAAIQEQNLETAGFDSARINELDQTWRGFSGNPDAEIIAEVLQNPAADFLRQQVAQSQGAITEVFIMDARGLNVAASQATSDFWQGDESKFQQTFPLGGSAVHFGDIELDESTQDVQGQVSMTIVDTETGEPVGAITVGVNITALM